MAEAAAAKVYNKNEDEWWLDALDGVKVPMHDIPMRGFYAYWPDKDKPPLPVAIWYAAGDRLMVKIGGEVKENGAGYWVGVMRNPIEYEVWKDVLDGKPWPTEIRINPADIKGDSTLRNMKSEGDALLDDVQEWIERGRKALKKGVPTNQQEADTVSDLGTKLLDLANEADAERLKKTKPHREAEAEINARWMPKVKTGKEVSRELKAAAGVWQTQERDRLLADQRKAQEAAAAVGVKDVQFEEPKVRSGTRKTVTMVKRSFLVIDDMKLVFGYFAGLEKLPPDLDETVRSVTMRILNSGLAVPGAKIEKKDVPQ